MPKVTTGIQKSSHSRFSNSWCILSYLSTFYVKFQIKISFPFWSCCVMELVETWFKFLYIHFFFLLSLWRIVCVERNFWYMFIHYSWDAACILQKPRRVMCSMPSKNKMNKGSNMPAVLKYYISSSCFRLWDQSHIGSVLRGKNYVQHLKYTFRVLHYLTMMTRSFRLASVIFIIEPLSQRRIWRSCNGTGQRKPWARNWICVLIST